jgi:peptide/nickel transport system substrate-binding protein
VKQLEAAALSSQMESHDYDANFGGWGTGTDPSTIKNLFKTGESRNYNSYSNKEVDDLLKQGELEFDQGKRAEIYGRIQKIIYDDQPFTFLYNQTAFYGFNKQLRGYRMSPRGPYHYGPGIMSVYQAAQH